MKETLIEVKNVCYYYSNEVLVLNKVSLSIHRGEFIALLGQNGSGKTTLAKHLNGLLIPRKGKVLIKGVDTKNLSVAKIARTVGYVFQNPEHQIFANTIFDEVAFGLRNIGVSTSEIRKRVNEALKWVDLNKPLDANPHFLSVGEKHRLAIASILVMKPEVIILDEPTTGLDYRRAKQLMELIKFLHKNGHTIILITHDMAFAAEYTLRTIILNKGEIVIDGTTKEVFSNTDLLLRNYLSPPQITELAIELNRKGYPISREIMSVKEMTDVFIKHIFK